MPVSSDNILLNKMDNIELDNLGEQPVEEEGEEETNIDTDWRDESVVIIGNPVREGLDEEKKCRPRIGKKARCY